MNTKWKILFSALVVCPVLSFASVCLGKGYSHINVGIANFTGYPLSVDMSKAAPAYNSSHAISTFTVPASSPGNLVWKNDAITITTCTEVGGNSIEGEGTLTFNFSNADLGATKPGAKPVLGNVAIPLTYTVKFNSNGGAGMSSQITAASLNNNIADEIPGTTPISGFAQINRYPSDSISDAYLDIVFYDLAPGVGGNQNVLRPFQVSTQSVTPP